METLFSFLEKRVSDCSSLLCVGLDPHLDDLPDKTAEAALEFCVNLIRNTSRYAAAFKPNAAFFEVFGAQGWEALHNVVEVINEESKRLGSRIPVILDAKRGDIASTARAYAKSAFEELGFDAITVNPYLGTDAIEPFLAYPEKGIFLLCKTSNPGSKDIQDLPVYTEKLYERVARMAQSLDRGNIGLVVGATHPSAIEQIRSVAPDLWFLVPGIGTQGGDLEKTLAAGLRSGGGGLLINVSRSLARADNPKEMAASLRDRMVDIQYFMGLPIKEKTRSVLLDSHLREIADGLLELGCVKFGSFTLKSGLTSPIYIDLRRLTGSPDLLSWISASYIKILEKLSFARIAALPYAALPIATAISLMHGWPMVYPRKETKSYGTRVEIEGIYEAGEEVVVIDDLATTGDSKFEAIEKLTQANLIVKHLVVLIDRQSGAKEALEAAGYQFHAVFKLTELLDYWENQHRVPVEQINAARIFLANS